MRRHLGLVVAVIALLVWTAVFVATAAPGDRGIPEQTRHATG